jgi:DNA polymerase III alpha subunit (gram-positive type)
MAYGFGEAVLQVMDFEGSPRSGVVEWGVVTLSAGAILETGTDRCQPEGLLAPMDSRTHGLVEEELRGKPRFRDLFPKFSGLRKAGIFCAHNHFVEEQFLKQVWPNPPFVPDWRTPGRQTVEWGPWSIHLSCPGKYIRIWRIMA